MSDMTSDAQNNLYDTLSANKNDKIVFKEVILGKATWRTTVDVTHGPEKYKACLQSIFEWRSNWCTSLFLNEMINS